MTLHRRFGKAQPATQPTTRLTRSIEGGLNSIHRKEPETHEANEIEADTLPPVGRFLWGRCEHNMCPSAKNSGFLIRPFRVGDNAKRRGYQRILGDVVG